MDFKAEAECLFDQATMKELAGILRVSEPSVIVALQTDLIETCAHYREIIATLPCDLPDAPFNMSLTKRAEWLETQVIKPCERLLQAIGDDMRPMFSTWPYPLSVPEFRDNTILESELREMLALATGLRADIRGQQEGDAGHNQELRAEVFYAIAGLARKHCPNVKPNRGVYDAERRRRGGIYVDAMMLIYLRITGLEDNLDRLISSEIREQS